MNDHLDEVPAKSTVPGTFPVPATESIPTSKAKQISEESAVDQHVFHPPPTKPAPPLPLERSEIRCYLGGWGGILKRVSVVKDCTVQHFHQIIQRKAFGILRVNELHQVGIFVKGQGVKSLNDAALVLDIFNSLSLTERLVYMECEEHPSKQVHLMKIFLENGVYKTLRCRSGMTAGECLDQLQEKTTSSDGEAFFGFDAATSLLTLILQNQEVRTLQCQENVFEILNEAKSRMEHSSPFWTFIICDSQRKACVANSFHPPSAAVVGVGNYSVLELLGKGGFGRVWRVVERGSDRIMALKVMNKEDVLTSGMESHVNVEKDIMDKVGSHPFVVQLYDSFQTDNRLYLTMECLDGGNLFQLLSARDTPFTESIARYFVAQIVLALESLHRERFIYRDLKLENVMLDCHGHVRLTDFGLSHRIPEGRDRVQSFSGTAVYLPPELLANDGVHGQEADWWSLGVALFLMVTQEPPFWSKDKNELWELIMKKDPEYHFHQNLSPEILDLFQKLLDKNPTTRLSGRQIRSHPWFAQTEWDKVLLKQQEEPLGLFPSAFLSPRTRKKTKPTPKAKPTDATPGVPKEDFDASFADMTSLWKDPQAVMTQFPGFRYIDQ